MVTDREKQGQGRDIVMIHGLWIGSWCLTLARKSLEKAGFRVFLFDYPTTSRSPQENADGLAAFIQKLDLPGPVHVVGYSLGGLVVLNLLRHHPDISFGRVVMLGSPLAGAKVAKFVQGLPGGKFLLGKSLKKGLMGDGPQDLPADVEVGMIAGTCNIGLTALLPPLPEPGDGIVALCETRIKGITAHQEVPLTHLGLVVSKKVISPIETFLRHGHF